MRTALAILFIWLAIGAAQARADFIRPTIAGFSTEEGGYGGRLAVNTVNGSGLSAESPTATHDSVSNDAWHTSVNDPARFGFADPGAVHAFIVFDLGQPTALDTAYIWQYSEAFDAPTYLGRGVKDFDILVAPASGIYTNLGTFQLAIGHADNHEPAQVFSLAGLGGGAVNNVRYVRFDIRDNYHVGVSDVVGLSEVRFGGVPASQAVPEPATIAMALTAGLAALAPSRGWRRLGLCQRAADASSSVTE